MGIHDRDWYREEQRERRMEGRRFSARPAPRNWLWIAVFWIALLVALFFIAKRFEYLIPTKWKPNIPSLELLRKELISDTPVRQIAPSRPAAMSKQSVRPPEVARRSTTQPQGVTTLYLCKSYGGSLFWSSGYCSSQKAFLERTATVPSGLSFDQQVRMADTEWKVAAASANTEPSPAVKTAIQCANLKRERDTIEGRYTNWQWQTVDVINADQTRMNGLRAEQARLGCPTQ